LALKLKMDDPSAAAAGGGAATIGVLANVIDWTQVASPEQILSAFLLAGAGAAATTIVKKVVSKVKNRKEPK